jgi:hypothetical protein
MLPVAKLAHAVMHAVEDAYGAAVGRPNVHVVPSSEQNLVQSLASAGSAPPAPLSPAAPASLPGAPPSLPAAPPSATLPAVPPLGPLPAASPPVPVPPVPVPPVPLPAEPPLAAPPPPLPPPPLPPLAAPPAPLPPLAAPPAPPVGVLESSLLLLQPWRAITPKIAMALPLRKSLVVPVLEAKDLPRFVACQGFGGNGPRPQVRHHKTIQGRETRPATPPC